MMIDQLLDYTEILLFSIEQLSIVYIYECHITPISITNLEEF